MTRDWKKIVEDVLTIGPLPPSVLIQLLRAWGIEEEKEFFRGWFYEPSHHKAEKLIMWGFDCDYWQFGDGCYITLRS